MCKRQQKPKRVMDNSMDTGKNKIRESNGRFTTKRKIRALQVRRDNGKNYGKKRKVLSDTKQCSPLVPVPEIPQGQRIFNVAHLAKEMICKFCKGFLHFQNIEDEKRVGFGSILYIRCMQCLLMNQVDSSEKYKSPAAALHTGQGHTKTASQATVMGIPSMSHTTWKRHERYLQPAIEKVKQNSMEEFIAEERRLTLENIEDLKRYLTMNVSCRSCDAGIPKDAHDCRRNFSGTSKAMEAEAARQLVVKNKLLLKYNVQVGIIAGDNDSSSIHAIHAEIDHPIIKVDDTNHTKKGVVNQLYKVTNSEDTLKELTKNSKDYLRRCFSFALEQHKGDAAGLAKALKNIPCHAFNKHNDCGDWCGYKADKENYDHRNIPDGFQSPELFKAITGIFDKLAEHADRFASVASSQSNESLNNSITRKLPRNVCYCLSESADNRVMCAICQKNLSFKYVEKILEFLNITPDDYTKEKNEAASNCLKKKIEKSKLPEVKLRRRANKIKNKRLSKVLGAKETNTYESNMTLDLNLANKKENTSSKTSYKTISNFKQEKLNLPVKISSNSTPVLVYLDLETGGFSYSADIIQTAFKCGDLIYTSYVTPTNKIDDSASKVHGLTYQGKQLYAHDKLVTSFPKRVVAGEIIQFLKSLKKPSILIGHNIKTFDMPRLIIFMYQADLLYEFYELVDGFTDSYILFREKFPEKKNKSGELKLTRLASELQISYENAHDAFADVCAVEKLLNFYNTDTDLINKKCDIKDSILKLQITLNQNVYVASFSPIKGALSKYIIKLICNIGVSLSDLRDKYQKEGELQTKLYLKNLKLPNVKTKKKYTTLKNCQVEVIISHLRS
ncbi:hypothetical protein PV328_011051 [Microctonus aethiopoides]|uniref:Exonuclease domain-containing protein n=1 Tax=Microctonus aethiopoides TaxID=144406 RepID=A0AA39C3Q3_9HYME|nr:hypothetical protein PV328_011051 [Microctonus aethiopoides]